MNDVIGRLRAADLAPMRSLNSLFGEVFEDVDSYAAHTPSDEFLTRFLADEDHIVLVARRGGEIVGGLVAYVLDKFEQERREVYLYDLAVSTAHQRNGIGRRLVEELRTVARDAGAYVVFVQADEGDEAVKFYESLRPSENLRTLNFDFDVA